VNHLGYPGTSGAGFIDYILADRTVIPEDSSARFSAHVVRLPDLHLANSARVISRHMPEPAEPGHPETGFVFCPFNNSFKILPQTFSVWMRLLHAVDGSVLWLGAFSPAAKGNLRKQADKAGIAPERLVFATHMERLEDHLARYRRADQFPDTLPCSGHTTSDALLAGLPVPTCMGRTLASRVAARLLTAAGIQELATRSLEAREALALRLATEPALLSSIHARLAGNFSIFPLFDYARFTRWLAVADVRMREHSERGEVLAAMSS